nr:hypothetical protein [Tanacetum cinerariifolium]
MMKESYPKEIKMAKAKENILNAEIQIISSESVQKYQETTIKEPSLENHGVIATKMKKKRLKTKNVLWPKHLMRIVPLFDTMLVHQGEGSGTPSEPHHTPFPKVESSHPTTSSIPLPSIPTAPIPPVTQPVTTPIIQYSRRVRIAQSSALPTIPDEPASPMRDVSEGEAYPTESGFIADQDRATIVKSSTLPHDSAPRVTSPAADEGSMQHNISELTALCTSLQRQYSELQAKFQAQEEEIVKLKDMVKVLEDRDGVAAKQARDDAQSRGGVSMKGRQLLKESVMTQRRLPGF